jgi:thiol-disulfide isomerase/thioredoxin
MVSVQIAALVVALSGVGETVLLDFQAPWCAPCRSMDSTISQIEHAGYPVRKINIDQDRTLAAQYNVQSIPCFVLLVDGQEAGRVNGAVRRGELIELFSKAGVGPNNTRHAIARAQSPDPPLRAVSLPGEVDRNPLTRSRSAQGGHGLEHSAVAAQDLIAASVRLTIQDPKGTSYGSGTIIDSRQGEALVLTCGHIFRDSQGQGQIAVDLFGPQAPQKVPGRLIGYDEKNDIGLVCIRPGVPVKVAPVAPKGYVFSKGDRVTTVGCNNGGPATAVVSKITGIDKFLGAPNVQVAGLPVQGRSGGGLFTADGQVIGVCNAADPADSEGLYAALGTIHQQLDKAGLSVVYENRPASGAPATEVAGGPNGPARRPQPKQTAGRSPRTDFPSPGPAADAGGGGLALNESERATLAELHKRGDSAEVICIVRSLSNPQAKSEVIMLDRASTAFLQQLGADRAAQDARHLTSLKVRGQQNQDRAVPFNQAP